MKLQNERLIKNCRKAVFVFPSPNVGEGGRRPDEVYQIQYLTPTLSYIGEGVLQVATWPGMTSENKVVYLTGMIKTNNNLYNLMAQLVQEQKSLWRIKDEYKKDAGKNKELAQFWIEVAVEKELLIEDLKAVIKMEME